MTAPLQRKHVFGIDFSGAKKAGKNIWIASGQIERGILQVGACRSLVEFRSTRSDRDTCLPALRDFVAEQTEGIVAMDFPFGLPRALLKSKTWLGFVKDFKTRFPSADDFKKACAGTVKGRELKRTTDIEARTPFSAYNLRLYRQTYYGISEVLGPLVIGQHARVLPMQKPLAGKPWLIEICPASWLKRRGLGERSYKGKTDEHRKNRAFLAEHLASQPKIFLSSDASSIAVENNGGDALDSLIAAYAAFEAYCSGWKPKTHGDEAALEGYVYF